MLFADHQFDELPDGTRIVVELCGSEEHGNEFVHSFVEFPNGGIIDFGISPRLPSVPDHNVTAVPSLHQLARQHRRRRLTVIGTESR